MIQTVRGPVDAAQWGPTSLHDHVLADASRLARPGLQPPPGGDEVCLENLGYLRWNMLGIADNLRLDDADLAVVELAHAVQAGQYGMVEASSLGLGPSHGALPEVSRRSGMHIVSAFGTYIPRTVPEPVASMDEAQLERLFSDALQVAVPGTHYRAGMLGIIGTTDQFVPREREVLRAAARAASGAGAAVSVRLDENARRGLEVVELMAAEGLPASRIVFTNADEYLDAAYWDELAGAGVVLEMCFGTEAVHLGRVDNPSDRERLAFFVDFVATHPHARHALGQSVWTKAQLRAFGGYGYAHLLTTIVPQLLSRGVTSSRIQTMLVDEPRRLLDRP